MASNIGLRTDASLRDDHHSPITTVMYLDLRVATQLKFYQDRLPKYASKLLHAGMRFVLFAKMMFVFCLAFHLRLISNSKLSFRTCSFLLFIIGVRFFFESLLILGSLTATILAFLGQSHWAAISTALVAMITAYSQFHGTEKKLLRYSDAVASLDSILLWWRTLTDVERASSDAKTELVTNCELVFQNERQGWVTTSMSTKLLKKASEDNLGDVDKV